jgi:hypothetical protein
VFGVASAFLNLREARPAAPVRVDAVCRGASSCSR